MKRFHITLSALFVALGAMLSTAHAEIKVASVNMAELNIMYYKRAESQATIVKQQDEIKEEIKGREEKLRTLSEQFQKKQAQVDPTLSDAQVKKLRDESNAIKNEFEAAREELKTFVQRREAALKELLSREQFIIARDIQEAVTAVATEGQYDLVVDASSVSANLGYRNFPYVKADFDITAAVVKRLNADAPADFNAEEELNRVRAAAGIPTETPAEK